MLREPMKYEDLKDGSGNIKCHRLMGRKHTFSKGTGMLTHWFSDSVEPGNKTVFTQF